MHGETIKIMNVNYPSPLTQRVTVKIPVRFNYVSCVDETLMALFHMCVVHFVLAVVQTNRSQVCVT